MTLSVTGICLKKHAELLGSRLKGWNFSTKILKMCFFPNLQNEFKEFFSQENDLVFGNDVCSVIEALRHQHDPNEWHLFTDSSKVSIKAVLHNRNNSHLYL
jgi:hypothetical protein